MGEKLMHQGKPWTGEGFPPDDARRAAVLGVDDATAACTCATHEHADGSVGWRGEGHAPGCPVRQPDAVKSIVGAAGDGDLCSCSPEWKGEGHQKGCAKRATVAPCTCRTLKWDGEGHSPDCVSQQIAEPVEALKRRGKKE